jgi:hypothetical protein
MWHSHQVGAGGDMLGLIMRGRGCGFGEAIEFAEPVVGQGAKSCRQRLWCTPLGELESIGPLLGPSQHRFHSIQGTAPERVPKYRSDIMNRIGLPSGRSSATLKEDQGGRL